MNRTFELVDVDALLDEIVLCVLEKTRARRVELLLVGEEEPCVHEARRESATEQLAERRLVLPMRHGERKLATIRVIGASAGALGDLRATVEQAARSLAAALQLRNALSTVQHHSVLVENLADTCFLAVNARGAVSDICGGATVLRTHLHPLIGRPLAESAAHDMLGLSPTDLRTKLDEARRDGRSESRTTLRSEQSEIEAHVVFMDVKMDGEFLCMIRDLTEVKAIENALLRRNHELSIAAERLKEVDMLKNEFMSNVSHELRTPLTAIIAYSEALLLTTPDAKTREEFLRVICEQGHKLQQLIAGLLDIAKLDSLATELKLQLGSLNDVIESAITTVQPTADKSRIRIVLDLEDDLPPVYLDELRSQQIVWNLITNAIKFSPANSQISVRSWSSKGRVWTAVSDEGPGIAPEHQKLIFEKFVQVDGSSTRRHGGVGLGLDLVKHLVELHGGEVELTSSLGDGSTFTFSIPIEKRREPRFGAKRQRTPSTADSN